MDATELGRWTRFAAKGGIGKCTALQDCIAEKPEDLMFMKGDEITVLMQLLDKPDEYLGYCEDVVGRFRGEFVHFHSRLKKPIMAKRSSTAPTAPTSSSSFMRPSSSQSAVTLAARDASPLSARSSPAPAHLSRSMSQGFSVSSSPDSQSFSRRLPSSASSPRSSPLPFSHSHPEDSHHLRSSESHSSISTGLDSVPTTPADFLRGTEDGVGVVSASGQPPGMQSKLDTEASPISRHEGAMESKSSPNSSVHPPTPWIIAQSEQEPPSHATDVAVLQDQSQDSLYLESESSTRISVALSDGEVGIGLSLLQDFLGGDGDDGASMMSRPSRTPSPALGDVDGPTSPDSPSSTVGGHAAPNVRSVSPSGSRYSASPESIRQPLPEQQKPPSLYAREVPSRSSVHPSVADSSDYGGEDWEGASDIYDQYRYSRYSMASKMSRLSRGSMHTVASAFGVPPVPLDFPTSTLAAETNASKELSGPAPLRLPLSLSPVSPEESATLQTANPTVPSKSGEEKHYIQTTETAEVSAGTGKGKPSPLILDSTQRTSPLLYAAFGSPLESPDPFSANAFVSPMSSAGFSPINLGGAATSLRQRLELERGPRVMSPIVQGYRMSGNGPGEKHVSNQDIVVDDEEEGGDLQPSSSQGVVTQNSPLSMRFGQDSEPSGSAAAASTSSQPSEKRGMIVTAAVAEPAPPPYTLSSPPTSPPPPSQSPVAQPSQQLRPQQPPPASSTVRPLNINRPPADPNTRTSLFLPHPHAPKPSLSPSGPMYGRQPPMPNPLQPHHVGPPPGSILHTIHMALTTGNPRQTTIYARFDHDLASSIGPVPIMFSLQPPMNVPANRPGSARPLRGSLVPTPPASPVPIPVHLPVDNARSPPPDSQQDQPDVAVNGAGPMPSGKVIPRANFFPKAGTTRPRSRSFSGFDSPFQAVPLPKGRSNGGGAPAAKEAPLSQAQRSKSVTVTPVTPVAVAAPQHATVSHAATVLRNFHAPSPLSLSQNNIVASSTSPVSPLSSSSPTQSTSPALAGKYAKRTSSLGRVASNVTSSNIVVPPVPQHSESKTALLSETPNASPSPSVFTPLRASGSLPSLRHSRSTNFPSTANHSGDTSPQRCASSQGRPFTEAATRQVRLAPGPSSPTTELAEPPSPARTTASSRSGLTMSIPRRSGDDRSVYPSERSPLSPNFDTMSDQKTVQVQDMDFELIQPAIPHSPLAGSSVDSLPLPVASPVREGAGFSFSDLASVAAPVDAGGANQPGRELQIANPLDAETHRQRESKWLQMTAAVPASQARKSKKFRKLLLEGVPVSMRYRVWAHLTDSAAKRMEGIYTRLGRRDRVASIDDIERDVQGLFTERPELQDASLVNLLQAYLTMVPDIQYNRGLAVVAAQLLRLTPEEDAFWTFTSMMDSHLRPYFSSNAIQLEVDASLFGKALEANDAGLAKKIFVDAAIPPVSICRPWFTTLFVDALSPEYFQRVWDMFLFEGITFLFRVGLAIISCCRRALLQSAGQDAVLALLSHPPANYLPPTPEAFLELAFSVKVKDDDIRKQRSKLEAQVKRQTQARALSLMPPGTSSISLPRS